MTHTPPRKLPRLRFSLRAMLLLFVVVGMLSAWWWLPYERRRRQQAAVEKMGASATWQENVVVSVRFPTAGPGSGMKLDDQLVHFKEVAGIQSLSLELLWVTNDGLRHLLPLRQLEELRLGRSFFVFDSADVVEYFHGEWNGFDLRTPEGMQALQSDIRQQLVILRNTEISDPGMEHVAKLSSLRTLSLDFTGVTDAGMAPLARLPRLEELSLRLTKVSDGGMKHVATFPALRKLDVGNNRYISGKSLPDIARIRTLRHLRPPYNITGYTEALHTMSQLEELDLTESNLTSVELEELVKQLPNCRILRPSEE